MVARKEKLLSILRTSTLIAPHAAQMSAIGWLQSACSVGNYSSLYPVCWYSIQLVWRSPVLSCGTWRSPDLGEGSISTSGLAPTSFISASLIGAIVKMLTVCWYGIQLVWRSLVLSCVTWRSPDLGEGSISTSDLAPTYFIYISKFDRNHC